MVMDISKNKPATKEAIQNFCDLYGYAAQFFKRREEVGQKWKHWRVTSVATGKVVFRIGAKRSIEQWLAGHEKAIKPAYFLYSGSSTGRWSGKLSQNLQQQIYTAHKYFDGIEARVLASQGDIIHGGITSEHTVPDAGGGSGHGDAGGHGVPPVRPLIVAPMGPRDRTQVRSHDGPGPHGPDVPGSDPASAEEAAEDPLIAELPQAVQNALILHGFIVRRIHPGNAQIGVRGPPRRRWLVSVMGGDNWMDGIERAIRWLADHPS